LPAIIAFRPPLKQPAAFPATRQNPDYPIKWVFTGHLTDCYDI